MITQADLQKGDSTTSQKKLARYWLILGYRSIGFTQTKIGEMFGISYQRVGQIIGGKK